MASENEISKVSENEFYSAAYEGFLSQGKLMGSRCTSCRALYLPPRPICPVCHSYEMELVGMKGKGKLTAYTVILAPPPFMAEEGFDRGHPYGCGVVELEEGVRITARILGLDVTHPELIRIGTPVVVAYQVKVHGNENRTFLAFRAVL